VHFLGETNHLAAQFDFRDRRRTLGRIRWFSGVRQRGEDEGQSAVQPLPLELARVSHECRSL
jgi:hypothetical protein